MEKLLHSLVFFGSAVGMFPFQNPKECSSKAFTFRWLSVGTAYCVFCLGYFILITTDYYTNVGPNFFGNYGIHSTPPLPYQVTNIAKLFTHACDATVIRLNALYYAREFFTLLNNFWRLRARLGNNTNAAGRHSIFAKVTFVVLTFLASGAVFVNKYFQIQKYYLIFLSDDFNSWLFPKHSHMTAILGVIPDVMHVLVLTFALMEFAFLVLTFLDLYSHCGQLLSAWLDEASRSKHDRIWDEGSVTDAIEALEILKRSLSLLNSVCGLNLCVLVTTGTVTVTWLTFAFATEGATFGISALLAVLLAFTMIAGLGEHFKSTVQHVKEEVQSSALKARVKGKDTYKLNANEHMIRPISKEFLKWNPNLYARGFFPINHKLIPMVVSASFTFTIFVFQLQAPN